MDNYLTCYSREHGTLMGDLKFKINEISLVSQRAYIFFGRQRKHS